jgi:ribosomal-protein-alanine N-acetyltransferase
MVLKNTYIRFGCVKMDFELRKWETSDADNFFKYSNNPEIAKNMRASFPSTLEESKKLVESFSYNDEVQQCCRAIVVNGETVGCIALFIKSDVYCKSAEIAYWLGEPFWGKGIMSEAIKQLCQIAFKQYDIVRIFAEPYAHNVGSRKALEKAGFVLEGIMKKSVYKNGRFFHYCMYALVNYPPLK